MVPIIQSSEYISGIKSEPKLYSFWMLIAGERNLPLLRDLTPEDKLYHGIIRSLASNDKAEFIKLYTERSKGKPESAMMAPFVSVDTLIFAIIVGVMKFDVEQNWIRYILSLRPRNDSTISFENILNKNYYSTDGRSEVVVVFLSLVCPELITEKFINDSFVRMRRKTDASLMKSDFEMMCTLRAEELIFTLKEGSDGELHSAYQIFVKRFLARTNVLSWLLLALIVSVLVFYSIRFYDGMKKFIDQENSFFTLLGFLGLSVLGFLKRVRRHLHWFLAFMFGLPKLIIEAHFKRD